MNNIFEVMQAIMIGSAVSRFLCNTGRDFKASDFLKECLILLNDEALKIQLRKQEQLVELLPSDVKHMLRSVQHSVETGLADTYRSVGGICYCRGEYATAEEFFKKALEIALKNGNRKGEAEDYGNLGEVFKSVGQYFKAKKYQEKALAIRIEIGDRKGEADSYANLGSVFQYLGDNVKAKECIEKALLIEIEIGDKNGQAASYQILGNVFNIQGEYVKAKKYYEKALAIHKEINDRNGEALSYGNLGNIFFSLGEYDEAGQYYEKALKIHIYNGNRNAEAMCYQNLGGAFLFLREYVKAEKHLEKALAIQIQIGDRNGQALSYGSLGLMFYSLSEFSKASEYQEKALAIGKEIGDRRIQAESYGNLGLLHISLGKYHMAEKYAKKALSLSKDIGEVNKEYRLLIVLTTSKLSQGKFHEAHSFLLQSIEKCEELRCFLENNDQFKISFLDAHAFPYQILSQLFCAAGNPNEALYVLELGRARGLADLMANQYSVEMQISANPESWVGMENIVKKESNRCCLYISYNNLEVLLWVIKTSGVIHFRKIIVNKDIIFDGIIKDLNVFFAENFLSFGILSEEECEDRSLTGTQPNMKSSDSQKESPTALRLVDDDDDEESKEPELNLSLYCKMLIAPVADLLENREIIIVPDRSLYRVPFAALPDESGKYLSDTFRIRIIPSLTTLKLIQDSPGDYHSQTGALIVGDPKVGQVIYKGRVEGLTRLPCAGKEAEIIGRLLGVQPLLGEHATKQAVLQRIHSVSLIHFAAHGNAERGEIALAPQGTSSEIPEEEDYLLTMSEISKVQLRAKLVVLSCCHSASRQIRAEGVIGMARAFLGSGARSVLVALWAIEDTATEQFMSRFYEYLVCGESASECLHETMKWMRGNGYSDVAQWAPFMLIGDNVTVEFGK